MASAAESVETVTSFYPFTLKEGVEAAKWGRSRSLTLKLPRPIYNALVMLAERLCTPPDVQMLARLLIVLGVTVLSAAASTGERRVRVCAGDRCVEVEIGACGLQV